VSEPVLLFEQNEYGTAVIKLNRPSAMNAFNMELKTALLDLVRHIANDDSVKAVVITGEGRAFSAGGDIKEMDPNRKPLANRERMRTMSEVIMTLHTMEKPVIMAVNGYAVGFGFNFALCGDIVLASDQAKFSQIFLQVGLVPDGGGFWFLPRMIGLHRAKELVFTAKMITAEEAYQMGIVNRVVPHDQLLDEAVKMANEMAQGPIKAIGVAKTLLNHCAATDLKTALDYEAWVQSVMAQTEDHEEGKRAFMEKRKPQFKGR